MEPNLDCTAALLSPDTGVLDTHAYMQSLQALAEEEGATFVFNTKVRQRETGGGMEEKERRTGRGHGEGEGRRTGR